jgi:hypothetical protein
VERGHERMWKGELNTRHMASRSGITVCAEGALAIAGTVQGMSAGSTAFNPHARTSSSSLSGSTLFAGGLAAGFPWTRGAAG